MKYDTIRLVFSAVFVTPGRLGTTSMRANSRARCVDAAFGLPGGVNDANSGRVTRASWSLRCGRDPEDRGPDDQMNARPGVLSLPGAPVYNEARPKIRAHEARRSRWIKIVIWRR